MDRHDAKPRRPSLMAGAPSPTAPGPSPARILADMDGPAPSGMRRRVPRVARRPAAVFVFIVLLGVLWWWQSGPTGAANKSMPDARDSGDSRAGDVIPDPGLGAATIIDEPFSGADVPNLSAMSQTAPGDEVNQDAFASSFAARGAIAAAAASGGASAGPDRGKPFGTSASARSRAAAAPPRARRLASNAGVVGKRAEPDLMATLLGNIQAHDNEPSALDSLIRKMEANDAHMAAGDKRTAAGAPAARSQEIQSRLRACPTANTETGVKCRLAICAEHAGRDPACPAN